MKKLNLLLLIFLAIIANAQIITGKILAEDGRKPIPYAKIGVENEARGTISDEMGNFTFNMNNISRDKNVKAEVGGYENFLQKVGDFFKDNPHEILLKEKVRNIAKSRSVRKN